MFQTTSLLSQLKESYIFNSQSIVASPHYSAFLEFGIPKFLQTLRDGM